jgi:hypothetical protein
MGGLLREDPKKLIAKSKNALAFSEMLDITPSEAYEYHDVIEEHIFGERELATPELVGGLMLLPITMALAANPLGLLLGVGTYQAVAEAESAAISLAKNKKYQVFQNRGLSEFLPEDTAEVTREIVDTFDIVGKMVAAGGIFRSSPKLGRKIARKIIVENRLPREIYISGKDLKAELQTGGILPAEHFEFVKALELGGKGYREALQKGLNIKISSEKVITITDRSWYAKVKKLFRVSPYEEVRVTGGKKPTYEFAAAPEEKPPVGKAEVKPPKVEIAPEKEKITVLRGGPLLAEVSPKTGPMFFTTRPDIAKSYAEKGEGIQTYELSRSSILEIGSEEYLKIASEWIENLLDKYAGPILYSDPPQEFLNWIEEEGFLGYSSSGGDFIRINKPYEAHVKRISLGEEPEVIGTKFEEFEKTLPDKMKKGKKIEDVKRIFNLLEERYPKINDKITRVIQATLADRYGETMGGVITLSTVDVPTLGHEIGELLQPMAQFGRGKTITGKEAENRDNLSDAIAYVLTEEAGLKTPRKKPIPELLDKARKLISGEQPEIPFPSMEEIREEAVREIKNPKTRIRLITGQTKISDLVREDVAFTAALRRAAKEARHALSMGKKEGYEKTKQHYLDLREKAKKREAQKVYVQKLVDNITRPLGSSIDFFYREGIENLREGIDPHFRSKKTIGAKERMQRFFAENPDRLAEMPTKFMKELNKKPLNDYTINDLQQISNEISQLRKLGKTKRKLKLIQQRREFEETKDTIVTTVSQGGKVKGEEVIVRDTRGKIKKTTVARAYSLRPTRIFDKLDRGQQFSGPAHKFFYDEVNKGVDKSLRTIDKRLDNARTKRKSLGLSHRDLLKSRKIDKVKLTVDEMLDIYVGWKNPRKKLALMYGNNISEEFATKVFDNLTPEEKEFGDWLASEYEGNYSRVREAHIEYTNEDMGYEPFYTPIRRMDVSPNSYKSELAEEILVRTNLKKAYVGKQFTIERKNIPREFQKPVYLSLYSTWMYQVPKNRVANPQIYKAFTRMEKVSQTLRKNMVVAYLSYNLVTMGKQLPSVLLYLPECGPAHLIASALEFAANPLKMIRFVNERDPQVKHRMIERELEEMKYSGKILKKVGRFGMRGIKGFDRTAVTIGWNAVYNKSILKLGEEEATRLAQDATLRTQPAAHAKDLPQLYTTNEFLNWGLQFTNQLNQIYNIATYDIPQDIKSRRLYKAFLSSLALAIVSLTIWTMSNRRLPEDEEDVMEALTEEAIMAVPLVGRAIMSSVKGWESPSPAYKGPVAIGKLISEQERAIKARAAVEAALVMLGVPYTGPRRIKVAIEKGDPLELLGPEKRKERGRRRYK